MRRMDVGLALSALCALSGMTGCFSYEGREVADVTPEPAPSTPSSSAQHEQPNVPSSNPEVQIGPIAPETLSLASWDPAVKTPSRPLAGGTLATSPHGTFAVASDPVGETVYLVDLAKEAVVRTAVFAGGVPGPVAASDTHAFVLLQGSGEVASLPLDETDALDEAAETEAAETEAAETEAVEVFQPTTAQVCTSPEGLVVDGDLLHVVCRGGQLVTLSQHDLAEKRRLVLEDDLHDVVVQGEYLIVSRLRTAQLLVVDTEGQIVQRLVPPELEGSQAGVLWKMRAASDNRLVLAYESLTTFAIEDDMPGGYGNFPCGTLAAPTVGVVELQKVEDQPKGVIAPFRAAWTQNSIGLSAGTLDAILVDSTVYTAIPGNALAQNGMPDVAMTDASADAGCGPITVGGGMHVPEVPVAIASVQLETGSDVLVQTLQPATLKFMNSGASIALYDEPRLDSGMKLFQMTVGSGISCSSCHPLGRTDAHVWHFTSVGPRRTQSIEGGISHLGPQHWDGEFVDFGELVDDVMSLRMGLMERVPDDHKEALLGFIDAIPAPQMDIVSDEEAASRGKILFEARDQQCAVCHSGDALTDNRTYDVGTGQALVTPSLVGVSHRLPIMHDGCASTLEERFGTCGGGDLHGKTSHLTPEQITDLVAYLKTL